MGPASSAMPGEESRFSGRKTPAKPVSKREFISYFKGFRYIAARTPTPALRGWDAVYTKS